ncbi:hypothetical protein N665_0041s0008 [Sinapis alba]|nr:hypothetical protein N665_0041s0008 [Sinapis alba]
MSKFVMFVLDFEYDIGFDFTLIESVLCLSISEIAKTRGGGQVGSRRSRRTQGLEVEDPTPQLKEKKRTAKKTASPKKNLVQTPTRRSSRIKKVAAEDDEIKDVTPAEDDEVEDVTPAQDDEVEDVTPEDGGVVEEDKDDQAEKAMSEEDKDNAGIEGEDDEDGAVNGKENEEEAANMEDDGVLNENGNEEEALNMEEDGVSNAQDDDIPSTEGVELAGDEVQIKKKEDQQSCVEWLKIPMKRLWSHSMTLVIILDLVQ